MRLIMAFPSRGQQPRNLLRNRGFWEWGLGFARISPVPHRTIQRGEPPDWGGANASPTSASFGKVTSKSGNRTVPLALKYIF